jgi:predicted dehydrogenase
MPHKATRRQFLETSAVAGIGFWVAGGLRAQESKSANERVSVACIGVGGKGSGDASEVSRLANIVALCDVDSNMIAKNARNHTAAKPYADYRKLLDEMDKSIDAVTVSTCDHMHAPIALHAMRMGKHCFVQKPSTRTIYEARLLGEVAKKMKVATQMGNQGTAGRSLRQVAAQIKAGALGTVTECHVWTNRPIWPQGIPRPEPAECPANLDWKLWLGVAPDRPYAKGYHDFNWRGWWDFGSGALGDMACHTVNLPYMACDLRDPASVQAETSGHNHDSYPAWSIIEFEFPATDKRPAVRFTWRDGGKRIDADLLGGSTAGQSGALIIGTKGKLWSRDDYGASNTFSNEVTPPTVEAGKDYIVSPGHIQEWINAIKGGPPAMSNFPDYAGRLTETILLGNLAVWVADKAGEKGQKVEWDPVNLKVKNITGLDQIVKPVYPKGYTLDA